VRAPRSRGHSRIVFLNRGDRCRHGPIRHPSRCRPVTAAAGWFPGLHTSTDSAHHTMSQPLPYSALWRSSQRPPHKTSAKDHRESRPVLTRTAVPIQVLWSSGTGWTRCKSSVRPRRRATNKSACCIAARSAGTRTNDRELIGSKRFVGRRECRFFASNSLLRDFILHTYDRNPGSVTRSESKTS
jgi:hypothetical protein